MVSLTINQLIQALEAAVKHEDLQEFEVVIKHLHSYSLAKDRNEIIQEIDKLTDKYPSLNLRESIGETEPEPCWIIKQLPTRHSIKLEGGLYFRLEEYLMKSVFPQPLKPKEMEKQINKLLNELLRDFLQLQQHGEA